MLLAGVGASATLSACALVPPAPAPRTPTPATPTPDAARSAVRDLGDALARAHADEQDPARSALLEWALDVAGEHAAAVGAAGPSWSPRPSPATPPTATPAGVGPLQDALATAVPIFRARALDAATEQPLVWAAMGAWARALSGEVGRPVAAREPRRDRLPPAVQTVAEAAQAAASAVEEALYGVQVAGGAVGLSPDDLTRIRARVVFWQQLRDDLRVALGPSPSPSPTPGPPWFAVGQPPDAEAAAALVVRLESAALPILGRSLAFGSDAVRARLTDAVGAVAADLPTWGGPLLRWPGWPS